jgi:hypothetical protein
LTALALLFAGLAVGVETLRFGHAGDVADWQVECGAWSLRDGILGQADSGSGRAAIWRPGQAFADLDLTVEFFIHAVGAGVKAPGIVYRAIDQETYCYIHFDLKNSQVVWVRSAVGKEWTDARRHRTPALKAETWQTARVVCTGPEHQVYLDGQLLFTERDDTLPSGVVGLRAGQGRIDFRNLRIEGTPAVPSPPFVVRVPPFAVVCADAGAGAYEAFPDVCRTHSGELLCVFYAGYGHVSVPTDGLPKGARIALCRSADDGKTWSAAETVVDSPIDDRDSSITQLANGDLLVAYMSYDPNRKPGTHQVFTVRSTDQGRTWGEPQRVPTPFTANEAVSEPIRELPDGRLLLPVYGSLADRTGPRYASGVVESLDGGQTWRTLALIRSDRYELCEPSLVRFADGRLFMAIRPDMTWCESLDGGKTWSEPAPMPVSGDAPYLLLTSKDILLCGFRHRPTSSTCVIASTDFGQTWGPMVTLDRVLGAYPSLVELPDGRVLVVYYTEGAGSDIRSVFLQADGSGVRVLDRE